ncbi:amino acid adenylation domain protein (plasmid) [Gloeothece citriformis PCC 7424]|uniref:Amino acid adenylation domain protein n=1 Tax=Gloeothece citriformis (strain PCC 7424) TaxID=65393 RepID=B7KLZ3_GLOC7|nr:non-ribosomal peptide synthetase [Gloeothece citriformis]ACK73815.1 amino acid adenylation domain protein [Gloeothece citriformis PCC 7424]
MNKKTIETIYPLSPVQQGILYHSLSSPNKGVYIVQTCYRFEGQKLNLEAFKQAWQEIINRHPVFRTSFHWDRYKEPFQVVHKQVTVVWQEYDWTHFSATEQQQQLTNFLSADSRSDFNLSQAPLLRLILIELDDKTYQFIWTKHHLISDGWSNARVLKELLDIYFALCYKKPSPVNRSRPYGDYIAWLGQQDLSQAQLYWQKILKGFTAPISLKLPATKEVFDYGERSLNLSQEETAILQTFAQHYKLTINTLVQGAWAILLSRYSGENDVVFGVTSSGRPPSLAGSESIVGLLINTLPLRVQFPDDAVVISWLQDLQSQQIEQQDYQYSPLSEVQRWSEVRGAVELFESILVFENYPKDAKVNAWGQDLGITQVRAQEKPHYAFTLSASLGSILSLQLLYHSHRCDGVTATQILGHLKTLLLGMAANPDRSLSLLPLLTPPEIEQLQIWNNTQALYPQHQCIHELFEEQVERSPLSIAVIWEDQQLTYEELNNRANQLAHYLKKRGIKPDSIVGLCLDRSLEMIIALFAILKAGGAYLPLDVALPSQRLALILEQAEISLLLTQQRHLKQFSQNPLEIFCLDRDWSIVAQNSKNNLPVETIPSHLAYVIYTSGSTGNPKGVMIEHRSLVNHTLVATDHYSITSSDRVLQFASISFDAAAEEIFPTLITGATLVLRSEEMLRTIPHFLQQCQNLALTVLDLPTAVWHQLTTELAEGSKLPSSVRLVIIGGESANPKFLALWQQQVSPSVRLMNSYGPTETTIVATICDLTDIAPSDIVPIGKPISNVQAYVLDSHLNPVPVGVSGELYLGGVGLARGYLNQPELTGEKFISNPFDKSLNSRLYKTGDKARYRRDGCLEYLGRIDHQVKVRGFRIELGEIETTLERSPSVQKAVVLLKENQSGQGNLIAYILPQKGKLILEDELRNFLQKSLPHYMIPSIFIPVDQFSLTTNGKVDRRLLPDPNLYRRTEVKAYIPPRTPIETKMAEIWANVLNLERVSLEDNFFELGGHSLLITQLLVKIRSDFGLDLPLRSLFESPTLAKLSERIEVLNQSKNVEPHSQVELDRQNLIADATLDLTISPNSNPFIFTSDPNSILLTGATGFLGAFLLADLLQQTQGKIYCLVRSHSSDAGLQKIKNSLKSYLLWQEDFSDRIIPLNGDLSKPLLGFSQEEFEHLANHIDVIYHNGAWVHHFYPYSVLKSTNVLGTEEILRLASLVKIKPVHFISTISVFGGNHSSGVKIIREQDSLDNTYIPTSGYVQSKWVAEQLVSLAGDRGLPVCIYRPGRISGHSQTGISNPNDFVYRLILGCLELKKAPSFDMSLDLVPVDYVSQGIVYLSRQENSIGKAFHLLNPYPFSSSQLIDWLQTKNYFINRVSDEEWQATLVNIAHNYPEHPLYSLIPFFMAHKSEKKALNSALIEFDCHNTITQLAQKGIVCPPITDQLLEAYFSSFVTGL